MICINHAIPYTSLIEEVMVDDEEDYSDKDWEQSFLVDFGRALNTSKEKHKQPNKEEHTATVHLHTSDTGANSRIEALRPADSSFLFNPTLIGQRHLCRIHRRKKGVGSLYPHYELFLEAAGGQRYFLFSAQRRKATRCSQYLISTNRADSGKFLEGVVAKVRYRANISCIYNE